MPQPGDGRSATQRVSVEERRQPLEPVARRAILGEDDGRQDGAHVPAELLRDVTSEPSLRVDRPEERLHIDEIRLQLDDQEHARCGVPGEEIDPTALAVSAVADLDPNEPNPPLEPALDQRAERRVRGIQQAIELRSIPEDAQVQPTAEAREDGFQCFDAKASGAATLERCDLAEAHPSPERQRRLRQPLTHP